MLADLVYYAPRSFSDLEKRQAISSTATSSTLGGPPESVSAVFFNEMAKRQIGRERCLEQGCSHFISLDSDEYYLKEEIQFAKRFVEESGVDGTACRYVVFHLSL